MAFRHRGPVLTSSRISSNHIINAGLGLALILSACAVISSLMGSSPAHALFPRGPNTVTAACFLSVGLAQLALRHRRQRIALACLIPVPALFAGSVLLSNGPARSHSFMGQSFLGSPSTLVISALTIALLLSMAGKPTTSRMAVLIAGMVTGAGLATLLGLRLPGGTALLSPMGGLLAALIGWAIIAFNHEVGWRGMLDPGTGEGPALRTIFLFLLLAPVAVSTLAFQLTNNSSMRADIVTLAAICAQIMLGLSLLFWLWSRIGRGIAVRRALTRALDAAPIAITDEDGCILYWSRGCEQLYGWPAASVYGRRKQNFLAHDRQPERSIVPQDGSDLREIELTEKRRDGSVVHVLEQVRTLGRDANGKTLFALVMTDVTAQHSAQARQTEMREELIHVSRLSAVGEAAAGLAHELRQPLAATTNFLGVADLILDKPVLDHERLRKTLTLASDQALRAGEIAQRFQAFLTRRPGQIRPEPVAETVGGAIDLATAGLDISRIAIDYHHQSSHAFIRADRVQIQQVLVNLIRNAIEAQAEAAHDAPSIALWTEDAPDDMVRISVRDDGPGIAEEVLRASYRPFISTKSDGMGLGLSICRRIVESHGGAIHVENSTDGGALVWFTVPAAIAEAEAATVS